MWFGYYSFSMKDTRYDIFRYRKVADKVENDGFEEGQLCYVKREKNSYILLAIGAAEVTYPFQKYDTMREALRALGWEGQRLAWWHKVPPHVQEDWADLEEEELLDNPVNHSPYPVIRVMSAMEIQEQEEAIKQFEKDEAVRREWEEKDQERVEWEEEEEYNAPRWNSHSRG